MAQVPQVLDAIQLSQATFNKIRQNLWWAFGYNLVGIPLAAGALLPSMGVALTPSVSGASLVLLDSNLQHSPLSVDDIWLQNSCLACICTWRQMWVLQSCGCNLPAPQRLALATYHRHFP